jgi:predicted transglutaminase-like cysteine proteinase
LPASRFPSSPRQDAFRRNLVHLFAGLVAGTLALLVLEGTAEAEASTAPGIFDSIEVKKSDLKPFPKWTGALERFITEKAANEGNCVPSATNKCHYSTWTQMIVALGDKDIYTKVKGVNDLMNRAPYVVDNMNWGVKDYWATPGQFFAKFGDCEDYAIVKFLSLRALGIPSEIMRIVIVQDLNLKVGHAIVSIDIDGRTYILDNQIKQVVEAASVRHYKPLFSLNEEAWWLHRPATRSRS